MRVFDDAHRDKIISFQALAKGKHLKFIGPKLSFLQRKFTKLILQSGNKHNYGLTMQFLIEHSYLNTNILIIGTFHAKSLS